MDNYQKSCCPNCSQAYYLKSVLDPKIRNIPLFLSCGHTMCESCITNILKFEEPIECKICHRDMQLTPDQIVQLHQKTVKLYSLFPVNLNMLGELTLQSIEKSPAAQETKEKSYFIDLHAIFNSVDVTKGQCMECHNQTSKMCQQCATVLCDACFNKSHKNFVIFKTHVLKNIEPMSVPNTCKLHKDKPLDYYCQDCKKPTCMDCLMVGGEKSCKNHNVVPMQEVNDSFLEDIMDIVPQVDETFRRLTQTAVDVGLLLYNSEHETGKSSDLTNTISSVKQNFSKISLAIQKHEREVIDTLMKLKSSEKDSLIKAQQDIARAIKKSKTVLNTINMAANPKKSKQINLPLLLDDAKQIVNMPWYLQKDESENALKVAVNEDLCTLISDYVHLEGNANSVYKLRASTELEGVEIPPAPPSPVYPPELAKDVRQSSKAAPSEKLPSPRFCRRVPAYRSKSGSVSSLNSLHSDSSDRGQYTYGDGFQSYQRPNVQSVQPFAESQHPKQLHEGSQELIYISHIVDPHNFFVQRACHQILVKEMLREFRNAATMPKPSLNHVTEGKLYLMFNKADNMWQRCRIVSIVRKDPANPTFVVFCIDFGSTETVSIDKLRLLPPARVQTPYPLAINCCLANCVPVAGAWTCDDAFLIQNIIDNKQAILHVRHIRSTSNYSVKLECDITTFEDGVSLAHALLFHERAKMPNTRLHYPKLHHAMEKPRIFMGNDLKPKSVEEVMITHVFSPDKFYVRKSHVTKVYEKLCEDLEQEYGLDQNASSVYLPEIGVAYAVNVSKCRETIEDVKWARGVPVELPGRGRVRLLLADHGATLLAHCSALRHLQHRFTTQRALVSECQLAGVTPPNKKWSEKSVALLQQFAGRLLTLHVEEAKGGAPGVTLYDKTDADNIVCVNALMIKNKFAVTFGIFMFNKDFDVSDQVYTNKSPLDPPQRRNKPGQVQILQKKDKGKDKTDGKELDAKDKGPLRLEAKVLHYQSPSLLYVSLVHQQKVFSELFEAIQKEYSKKSSPGKTEWVVGDRCCSFCSLSQTWRRAVILEFEGENAKVFYSDFACVETVPKTSLKELKSEFTAIGDAAIKCHLCGIVPADGNEEWPTITKEYLKELLDAYHRVFITKLGNFKNNSMPVEMWVFHMIQGGALEPNKSEWRCLNKKIIEQGLGIPDKAHKESTVEEASKDNMLSFLKNVTGSVDEWLQLEPLPTKPLATQPAAQSEALDESSGDEERPSEASTSANTMFITDWLPPEHLPTKEFTGMPTYIDNDGVVFLHDITQQATMDMIRNALDVRFKGPDPKAKYAKWAVGEPCIAMFYLDSKFYRGRVIHVDKEAANCIIHYIDYGNEEICSYENLRKSIVLHQIPVQAYKCVLNRIRPIGPHWDRQTLDYIHKSVVEKQCFVKITGEPRGDLIPIDLKYDKLWINDHLVDFEMAVYTDGSKAVVRKFKGDKTKKREPEPVEVHNDSGPDFIVEEDDKFSSTVTSFSKSTEMMDWNKVIEDEEQSKEIDGKFIAYPSNDLEEFICNIGFINDVKTLELTIIHNDESNVVYEEMFEEIQVEGQNRPPLDGIFENKACIALFHEDSLWYRASILQYSESEGRVKVKYVDYGNVEVISLADIREIDEAWTALPPKTICARLSKVQVNKDEKMNVIADEYAKTFLDKGPFNAKVINYVDSVPNVELRNDAGELVYEHLIQTEIFVKICDD